MGSGKGLCSQGPAEPWGGRGDAGGHCWSSSGNGRPLGALWSLCHDTERGAILGHPWVCPSTSVIWESAEFGRQHQLFSVSPHGMGSSLTPGAEAALKLFPSRPHFGSL